jgi:anti-sigma regulatory factor (Ser/Thr protein kinase)
MALPKGRTNIFSASFPPAVGSIPEARHFLSETIGPRVASEELGVALLLGSELATNAVVHADTPFVVGVAVAPGTLRVSVSDSDDHEPQVADRDVTTRGGFGLFLVQELAARWGVDRMVDDGKRVWFELDLGPELNQPPHRSDGRPPRHDSAF